MASSGQRVSGLREEDDWSSIEQRLANNLRDLGFDVFNYYVLRPPAGMPAPQNMRSYPEEWLDHYDASNYALIDPAFSKAAMTVLPFKWDLLYGHPETSDRGRRLFNEAEEFGLRVGVSVPIHGPANGLAVLSVASAQRGDMLQARWEQTLDDLMIVGARLHEAQLQRAAAENDYAEPNLTDRERECLTWTSRGKTSWEVGEILKISEKTVLFHVNNAMRKLDVYSKHHAVVKSIIMGLIRP